jgi:hypothetical protein
MVGQLARQLHQVRIAPKGMGLNDFVAMQEGFFAAEGLDVEFDWKTFRGTQSSWKGLEYLQRPQDRPYTHDNADVIQGACVWGSICNASAGMGRFVADAYGVSPWAIFVRPDSPIRNLEKYLPLWKLAVPAEFESVHPWDFTRFGRGERFVYRPIPRSEFDEVLAQVKRWGLDQYLKDKTFEHLAADLAAGVAR